jgi:hypothetical protein
MGKNRQIDAAAWAGYKVCKDHEKRFQSSPDNRGNVKETAPSAKHIMTDFAHATGLSPAIDVPLRYLWTDAFAVCNFLGIHKEKSDTEFRALALDLISQVHSTLGRYRKDDSRKGWISGLEEKEAFLHPTAGGLRIGKELRERKPTEPLDERLEWDRDGQYFHYLTKWMHALNQATRVTGESIYNRWAVELARAIHARFVYAPSTVARQRRMYWKMSTDLSYPLVRSMGLHDPLDGLITYTQLAATARQGQDESAVLEEEIADMAAMCEGRSWVTDDPLGIGSLLCDAFRVAQLMMAGYFSQSGLLAILLDASLRGLEALDLDLLDLPAHHRLAFREFGLSIGLHAFQRLSRLVGENRPFLSEHGVDDRIEALVKYGRLAETIEGFWTPAERQREESWMNHRHINMAMLATSLSPDGFLAL